MSFAVDKNPSFRQVFDLLQQAEGPLVAFYSTGDGFSPLIGAFPLESLTSLSPQEILSFEARHQDHLIASAFPFEFGEAPAILHAFGAWVQVSRTGYTIDGPDPKAKAKLKQAFETHATPSSCPPLGLDENQIDPQQHQEAIKQIFKWIRAGEVYQLNYTTQLTTSTRADPRSCFLPAISQSPPPFSGFFESAGLTLLSLSPERFIQTESGRIYTDPIKGTGPRVEGDTGDRKQRAWLENSAKEAAELNMITDLLRNDLGRICQTGSVQVETPRTVSTHLEVLHTHTRVSGLLKAPYHGLNLLLKMIPGGSISGCPKTRATELIKEIESQPRGFYTGALGYQLPGGDLCFNLMIRTLVFEQGQVSLGVGGGITIDSDPASELAEAKQKARSVLTRFTDR